MSALTEKVAREHVRRDGSAGDGYSEPRESWTSCSCGAHVWAWQQFYAETDEDPDENWTQHIAYVIEAAVRAQVAADQERAWREGYYTGKRDYAGSVMGGVPISTPNPYAARIAEEVGT